MADTIDACRKSGQIGLVAGPSGIGKTTAARAVAEALDDDGATAHYVMMTRAADGLQPGLLRIARAIGASAQPNAASADIYDAVVWCIANWPRGSVLVLDEAQFMSEALIDALRNVSDDLRGRRLRRGIVMVGTADLAARIDGRAGGRAKHYEPLRGRLYLAELHSLADDDFVAVTQALGVAGPGAVAAIARAGAGRGGLHNVARVVEAARRRWRASLVARPYPGGDAGHRGGVMTERSRPVPSPADLIETLLKDAGREAPPAAGAVPPVSITIHLAAGAVLNVSIGAACDSKEG